MDHAVSSEMHERRRHAAGEIRRRLVAHLAAGGTTDTAGGTLERDRSIYVDSARAERERRELFLEQPLVAGLSQDIASAGDCLLFEDAGPPILIVRAGDGRLRAFLNMCTHRASRLVGAHANGRCERRDRLTCPFHAWSFDLDGRLAAVPGRDGFDAATLSRRNLVPVAVAEWHGLVFVQASGPVREIDVPAYLGAFAPEMAQLELAALVPIRSSRLTANANWKLALDTYCEGYHFGTLHRSTIGRSHHSNVAVFDDFAPHWRLSFADRALDALVGNPESGWPDAEYGGVHFLFPNTIIVAGTLAPGETGVRVFRLFPGAGAGMMACRIAVYASPSVARDASRVEREFAFDDAESEITQEDYRMAVEAYRNLENAPEGFSVVYGRNEPALQAFHRAITEKIGEPG